MAIKEPEEVAAPKEPAPGRLFVVIDESAASLSMWRSVQQQNLKPGDAVTLLTAVEVNSSWIALAEASAASNGRKVSKEIERQQTDAAKEEAKELIRRHKAEASPDGWTVDSMIVTAKSTGAGPALVRFLEETQTASDRVLVPEPAELSWLETVWAWLTGEWPVSDYLVRHAPCPVQVVPSAPLAVGSA